MGSIGGRSNREEAEEDVRGGLGSTAFLPLLLPPMIPDLPSSNKGYGLLMKAGWKEGQGLGARGQGAAAFLAPASQQHSKGLGYEKSGKKKKKKSKR